MKHKGEDLGFISKKEMKPDIANLHSAGTLSSLPFTQRKICQNTTVNSRTYQPEERIIQLWKRFLYYQRTKVLDLNEIRENIRNTPFNPNLCLATCPQRNKFGGAGRSWPSKTCLNKVPVTLCQQSCLLGTMELEFQHTGS